MPSSFPSRFREAVLDSSFASSEPPIRGTPGDDTLSAPAGDPGEFFEGTRLFGGAGDDSLTGGRPNEILLGGGGNDTLLGGVGLGREYLLGGAGRDSINGGGGDDILYGGQGRDTLDGGGNSDRFVLNTADRGVDTIIQFVSGSDFILLKLRTEELSLGGIAPGSPVEDEQFTVGPAATTAEQRFIFDPVARTLAFDVDGNGSAEAQILARFKFSTDIARTDLVILTSDFGQDFPFLG
jgi:Ca2+-binding RTX toxin-like protein